MKPSEKTTPDIPITPLISRAAGVVASKLGFTCGQIELTSTCFQKCTACSSWVDNLKGTVRGTWELEEVKTLCLELQSMPSFRWLTLTGGDPQAWEPLDEFLDWFLAGHFDFHISINSALARPINDAPLWRAALSGIRLSLDATDAGIYQKVRGDRANSPELVLARFAELKHPNSSILAVFYEESIGHMLPYVRYLRTMWEQGPLRFVDRVGLTAALGPKGVGRDINLYWRAWDEQITALEEDTPCDLQVDYHGSGRVSAQFFQDNPTAFHDVPCRIGYYTFHLKADKMWFACCLLGGEAIDTQTEYSLGYYDPGDANYGVTAFYDVYVPQMMYRNPACREVCQWKQIACNVEADSAINGRSLKIG